MDIEGPPDALPVGDAWTSLRSHAALRSRLVVALLVAMLAGGGYFVVKVAWPAEQRTFNKLGLQLKALAGLRMPNELALIGTFDNGVHFRFAAACPVTYRLWASSLGRTETCQVAMASFTKWATANRTTNQGDCGGYTIRGRFVVSLGVVPKGSSLLPLHGVGVLPEGPVVDVQVFG